MNLQQLCKLALECRREAESMTPDELDGWYEKHVGYRIRVDNPGCSRQEQTHMVAASMFYDKADLGLTPRTERVEQKLEAAIMRLDLGSVLWLERHAEGAEA